MIFINRRNNRNYNKPIINQSFNPISIIPISESASSIKQKAPEKIVKKERVKEMLWGEPTWFLFHTLAEKIKDDYFTTLKNELVGFIKQICYNLPCPDCTEHATRFINGVNFDAIKTKEQLKVFFFNFHNEINKRKDYEYFDLSDTDKYKNAITINIAKNFFYHFGKKNYNVKLDVSGYQRTILLKRFRTWLENNYYCFIE